jgi:hypothetical protein
MEERTNDSVAARFPGLPGSGRERSPRHEAVDVLRETAIFAKTLSSAPRHDRAVRPTADNSAEAPCADRQTGDIPMASIRKEILLQSSPEKVWAAVRDVGALHTRLVPGFVVDTRLEEGARVVTFGNGMVARELIVDLDDGARRLVWAVVGGRLTHHNASVQVFAHGAGGSRLVWIADLLPNEVAGDIRGMIEQAAAVMQRTLDRL